MDVRLDSPGDEVGVDTAFMFIAPEVKADGYTIAFLEVLSEFRLFLHEDKSDELRKLPFCLEHDFSFSESGCEALNSANAFEFAHYVVSHALMVTELRGT